jgi:hypothetical protein
MTFITGSITNANPGPALYSAIETAALAGGWTLEDTVVIGGNTHKVLKSAAAGNVQGLDWFLDINYPTTGTTGGIRFAPFEGYTAASDVGLRGPYATTDSTIEGTNYSRFGATTSALETSWANTASYTNLSVALTTSAFTYNISITRNRIIVQLTNDQTKIAYTGFFTPSSAHSTHAGASLFPLVMTVLTNSSARAQSSGGSASAAALTRAPKAAGTNLGQTWSWANSVAIPLTDLSLSGLSTGQAGVAVSPFTNTTGLIPVPVVMGYPSQFVGAYHGASVGFLDGVAVGQVLSSAVRGDELTIGSDTWYATSPSSTFAIFFKGA